MHFLIHFKHQKTRAADAPPRSIERILWRLQIIAYAVVRALGQPSVQYHISLLLATALALLVGGMVYTPPTHAPIAGVSIGTY